MLFYRSNKPDEIQEEKKEIVTKKKKKKKKPVKNVFKVEDVLPENSNQLKNKIVEDCKKVIPPQNIRKITKTKQVKKLQNISSQNESKVLKITENGKMCENRKKDYTPNKKKMIKNIKKDEKQKVVSTPDDKKIINNVKIGEKRKKDYINKNGSNKKRKFSDKKFKSNKEPSALESMTDDRLKAYGINPKKFRNKLKFGNK